jgi:GNAT superfamily N-acetyltransferase
MIEIRMAAGAEDGLLLAMYEWLFEPPGYRPQGWNTERARSALAEAIAADDAAVLVADADGALVGICTAYLDLNSVRFGKRCWIEDLAVDPGWRSQGIGGAMLDAAREWAKAAGATHLELDTGLARGDAQRFYERQGETHKGISYSWAL